MAGRICGRAAQMMLTCLFVLNLRLQRSAADDRQRARLPHHAAALTQANLDLRQSLTAGTLHRERESARFGPAKPTC